MNKNKQRSATSSQTNKKNTPKSHDVGILTYAESNYWSQRHLNWIVYQVSKPRLPNNFDSELKWITKYIPKYLHKFIGNHNREIISSLRTIGDGFDLQQTLPSYMIISGPSGSGKTAIMTAFLSERQMAMGFDNTKIDGFLLKIDGSNRGLKFDKIINSFYEQDLIPNLKVTFRVLVFDNADSILPSVQQSMKPLLESLEPTLRYIFICRDASKLVGFIQAKGTFFRTKSISERDAITVALSVCKGEDVGYEREGIQALFDMHTDNSTSDIVNSIQETFQRFHFISKENIRKLATIKGIVQRSPEVLAYVAIQPLPRCPICTLVPPCSHKSLAVMCAEGRARRHALPKHVGSIECPEFVRFGRCSVFNKAGKCSLHHPPKAHVVVDVPVRCPQCSLVWPCQHCAFSASRNAVLSLLIDIRQRLQQLKKLSGPKAPMSTVAVLTKEFPDFKGQMQRLTQMFFVKEKLDVAAKADDWITRSLVIESHVYELRTHILRNTFQDLLASPLLMRRENAPQSASSSVPSAGGDCDSVVSKGSTRTGMPEAGPNGSKFQASNGKTQPQETSIGPDLATRPSLVLEASLEENSAYKAQPWIEFL